MRVDLNADVGESFGAYSIGCDRALMRSITSANIAAGFHGGDPSVLRQTIRLAREHGVAIGAHPGFPDLGGFGRREMRLSADEAEDIVLYQIAAVAGVARAEGATLHHVKPHGALYNLAARDAALASAIVKAIVAADPRLILYGLPNSELLKAGLGAGLRVAAEGFADRSYEPDGSLTSRQKIGAVIEDTDNVVARAVRLVNERTIIAADGTSISLDVQTVCVHGDTPGAADLAVRLRAGFAAAGIEVRAVELP
jgi:UPF0271 protein